MTNKTVLDMASTFMFGLKSLLEYEEFIRKEGQDHKPKVAKLSDYRTEPLHILDTSLDPTLLTPSEKSFGPTNHPRKPKKASNRTPP